MSRLPIENDTSQPNILNGYCLVTYPPDPLPLIREGGVRLINNPNISRFHPSAIYYKI